MGRQIEFIVFGPLRSGTTLLRLMIDSHPLLSNVGEFDYLFDFTQKTNHGLRIDRRGIQNHFAFQQFGFQFDDTLDDDALFSDLLGQIMRRGTGICSINIHREADRVLQFLPHAKMVKLHRDPRDVALSTMEMGWAGTPYHGVGHWIETERAWERAKKMLPPDRRFELRFEDLVRNPEQELDRLCAFIGTDFDPAMLRYSARSSYPPVNPSIAFKWKRKGMTSAMSALVVSRARDLVERRGYDVDAEPRTPTQFQRLLLAIRNKLGIWHFGMRAYGVRNFLMEKLSRRLGLVELHEQVMNRHINPVTVARLK